MFYYNKLCVKKKEKNITFHKTLNNNFSNTLFKSALKVLLYCARNYECEYIMIMMVYKP